MKRAVLLLAHGAPRNLEEVDEYVLHIRHGRPLEPHLMATIKDRYRQVGGSPLLHWTHRQAEELQKRMERELPAAGNVYMGMRHSHPFIKETIDQMSTQQIESFIAVCLAPQFSRLTIGAYQKALDEAIAASGSAMQYSFLTTYARHPKLIHAFAAQLKDALNLHPQAFIIFTAHSLPERVLAEADPYDYETKKTACLVAQAVGVKDWRFAYQSQGMTSEKWLGPTVEARIDEISALQRNEIIVAPIGFVCDHVEILYDIDVAFKGYAKARGIDLYRTASLNDSHEFVDLLFDLIRERV